MDTSAGMRRRKGTHPEKAGDTDQNEIAIEFDLSTTNAPGPKKPQEQSTSEAGRLSTPVVTKTSLWQKISFSPRFFGASIFAARIPFVRAADAGDEFTNNFVTDLAPLLALFGERVATQFMSESFTIADSIIFAVAPLGIMTAMVGAIRVGGPSELRAIIGRAKESRSTVELELMSSTSGEVCELWNGTGVVRVLGKSPIIELIYVIPEDDNPENISEQTSLQKWQDDLGIYDFDSALKQRDEKKLPTQIRPPNPENWSSAILYSDLAPNLSLNMGGQTVPVLELWVAAIFGVILQLGVVVFAGVSVLLSNRSSSFKKDGATPPSHAFPLMAVGTLLLVLGMFFCSHIVDRSTTEETWEFERIEGAKVKVAWLQQGGEVNDQLFESHALFPPVLKNPNQANILSRFLPAAINIFISTIKCCAYLAYSFGVMRPRRNSLGNIAAKICSHAQRRYRSIKPYYSLYFRLLARSLGNRLRALKNLFGRLSSWDFPPYLRNISIERKPCIRRSRKSDLGTRGQVSLVVLAIGASLCGFFGQFLGLRLLHWSVTVSQLVITVIMTVLRAWVRRNLIHKPMNKKLEAGYELDWMAREITDCHQWSVVTWGFDRPASFDSNFATNVATTRRRLGTLSRWPSQWLKAIDSTAKSIEGVMNFLFSSEEVTLERGYWSTRESFEWKVLVEVVDSSKEGHLEELTLNMRRNRLLDGPWGPWRASKNEIEAVIGLWMLHFKDIERGKAASLEHRNDPQNEEDNLEGNRSTLRILGPCDNEGRINYERWITRGSDFVTVDDTYLSQFKRKRGLFHHIIGIPRKSISRIKDPLLGVISDTSLEKLCGQTILTQYISSVAEHINDIGAKILLREGSKGERKAFGMGTAVLSGLAKEIELTGLANTEEAYMSLVPMLFGKLPKSHDTGFFGAFVEVSKSHMENGRFEQAEWVLLWLFHCTETSANVLKEKNKWMKAGKIYSDLRQACTIISESNEYTDEVDKRIISFYENVFLAVCERAQHDSNDAGLPHTINLIVQCMTSVLGETSEKTLNLWKEKHARKFPKDLATASVDEKLLEAARNGEVLYVQKLLHMRANIETHDSSLRTPLILASMSGHAAVVQILIQNHARTTAQDYWGQNSLHHASSKNHAPVVLVLLLTNVSTGVQNTKGETALDLALKNKAGGDVDLLLFYGAEDLDGNARRLSREGAIKGSGTRIELISPDKLDEETLYWAVWKGSRRSIQHLAKRGFGIKWRDKQMQTPLHIAALQGSVDVVRILLENNVDIEANEGDRKTALHLASANGHMKTVRLFLDRGVNKEARDTNGWTGLHHAADEGHLETVRLLLERGVDKEAKYTNGWTALHFAADRGHLETVRLLLDRGVDKGLRHDYGDTAEDLARDSFHPDIAAMIAAYPLPAA